MLCDNLYTFVSLETAGNHSIVDVCLRPESEIYAVHFKGMPVTPGACLVQMACELASRCAGRPFEVAEAADIRFLHPILPGEMTALQFQFECDPESDLWNVQVLAGETLCARMKLTLKP